jgi:hypothetical protein
MCCENCHVIQAQLESANQEIFRLKATLEKIKKILDSNDKIKENKNANL